MAYKPRLTRWLFNAVADSIATSGSKEQLVRKLADLFQKGNVGFNRERFSQRCGIDVTRKEQQ